VTSHSRRKAGMASTLRTRQEVAADSWGGPSSGVAALVVVDAAGWTSAGGDPGSDRPGCPESACAGRG
jgi:hypothetical protein